MRLTIIGYEVNRFCVWSLYLTFVLGLRDGCDRGEVASVLGGRDRLGSGSGEKTQAPH